MMYNDVSIGIWSFHMVLVSVLVSVCLVQVVRILLPTPAVTHGCVLSGVHCTPTSTPMPPESFSEASVCSYA